MNEAKQILRWSIPGWIFILMFVINYFIIRIGVFIVKRYLHHDLTQLFMEFGEFFLSSTIFYAVGTAILGIPLGYIIYQGYNVYHYKFEKGLNQEFPKLFRNVEINIGNNDPNFYKNLPFKYRRKFFDKDRVFANMYFVLNKKIKNKTLLEREQSLSDMSHSLGAAAFSIRLSLLLFITILFITINYLCIESILFFIIFCFFILAIITILTMLIFFMLARSRSKVKLHQIFIIYKLSKEF